MAKDGYVMFTNAAEYEVMHAQGRTALGLPRTEIHNGRLAPDKQKTIDVALHRTNQINLDDAKVVVHIESGFWPAILIQDLIFLTRAEVADYFPQDIL